MLHLPGAGKSFGLPGNVTTLADLLEKHAVHTPQKPAVIHGRTSLTYAGLRAQGVALACALLREGLAPGARIAVIAENRVEFAVLVAAAAMGGFTLVPLNTRLLGHEIELALQTSGAEVAFADATVSPAAASHVRWIGFESDEFARLAEPVLHQPSPRRATAGDALMQYATGGTSGTPKSCLITEANLLAQTVNFMDAIGLNAADRYGLLMPFFHMAAGGMAIALLALGATGVILPRRDPALLMDMLARERVSRVNLPGAVLRDLSAARLLHLLPDMRWLGAGNGSEIELQREISNTVCPRVWGWYGQTEATNITTSPRSTMQAQSGFGCIGRPAFTARVRVVGPAGQDVAEGEVGELWTAGPHVMAGYWRNPGETAAMMSGEWLKSGDLVRRAADGSLFLVDRLKEIIKSGGETIYPRQLELVLEQHPAIAEAAVIAVPHPRWGESPRAVVVLKPGCLLNEDEVIAHCRTHLAAFMRPTSVAFAQALQRNVAGKIRKDLVRQTWGSNAMQTVKVTA